MIRPITSLLIIYVAFVLEASAVAADPRGVEPRWLLVAAAYLVWTQRIAHAVLWGGLCGLLIDVLSGVQLGGGVAIVSPLAWGLSWLRRDRRWSSGVAFLLNTFILTALCVVAFTGLASILSGTSLPATRPLLFLAAGQGAMTALWGGSVWLVFRGLAGIARRILPPLDWRQTASS
jgi:cell shape-determining protein MreD